MAEAGKTIDIGLLERRSDDGPRPQRQSSLSTSDQSTGTGNAAAVRGPLHLDWLDCALICLFLLGLYTNYTIQISAKVPFPSVPAGIAGMILLWRRRDLIKPAHLAGLLGVLALYLISILCATNIEFLPRRTNGLIQLTYSITIGYALFLTVTQGTRQQIGRLFLGFALVILIGCLLETLCRPAADERCGSQRSLQQRACTRTICATCCSTIASGPSSSRRSPPA